MVLGSAGARSEVPTGVTAGAAAAPPAPALPVVLPLALAAAA